MGEDVAGFWSYVQADNAGDGGRILSLLGKLRDEYRLQTGEELTIFVDRDSLEWGAEWDQRIDDAIAGTTFFIPIITPSYFRSQACRDELLKFTREAKRLGLEQLLMPVYWVTVTELESDPDASADEAIKLVARYQWEDLREARLEDESSSTFRKAVSRLAAELARRAANVSSTVQDAPDVDELAGRASDGGEDSEPGIIEKLAASEEAFPELNEAMEQLGVEIEKVGALVADADQAMREAQRRSGGMKAQLLITERLARALEEPAEEIERLGHGYAQALAELDPGIHVTLDAAAAGSDGTPEGDSDRTEFLRSVREMAENADSALAELDSMVEGLRDVAKLSRSLRSPLARMRTGLQGVLDGRAIIEEWGRRASEIERDDDGPTPEVPS